MYEPVFIIRNYDKRAITEVLQSIGRPEFMSAVSQAMIPRPQMKELYLELVKYQCYLMKVGDFHDVRILQVHIEDIPARGWVLYAHNEKIRKNK